MNKKTKTCLIPDKPIEKPTEDLFHHYHYAQSIVQLIHNIPKDETYSIGLVGEWGNGKTSILNLTKSILNSEKQKKDIIYFDYNPWNITNKNMLIKEFFELLKSNLPIKKRQYKLMRNIDLYCNLVTEEVKNIPMVGNALSSFIHYISIKLGIEKNNTLLGQKILLTQLLKDACKKKIVVFIDDLDRLSGDEILLVFKLLKEIADLPKISFIVAYDKKQILKELSNSCIYDAKKYVKKFFQIEWELPKQDNNIYKDILTNYLKNILKENEFQDYEQYFSDLYNLAIAPFLNNIRDLKQLFNTFNLSYINIGNEVQSVDLLILTAINLYANPLYNYIRENKFILVDANNDITWKSTMDIKSIYDEIYNHFDEQFRDKYISILLNLFPYFSKLVTKKSYLPRNHYLSNYILNSKYFYLYFNQYLDSNILPHEELERFFNQEDYRNQVIFLQNIYTKNLNQFDFILETIDDSVYDLNFTQTKIILKSMLTYYGIVEGHTTRPGYILQNYTRIKPICRNLILELSNIGKEATSVIIKNFINSNDMKYFYKCISSILFDSTDPDNRLISDIKEVIDMFISWINKNKDKIELLDYDGRNSVFQLYENYDKKELIDFYNSNFDNEENFCKLIINFKYKWIESESDCYTFWNTRYLGLNAIQKQVKYIKGIITSKFISSLDQEYQLIIAKYCLTFNISELTNNLTDEREVIELWEKWQE